MTEKPKEVKISEFLSTYAEIHAFIHGVYSGITEWKGIDSATMQNPDVQKEVHYAKGGYILGTFLRIAIIIILAKTMV